MLAERIRFAGNEEAQVKKAFEIVYERMPAPEELASSLSFLREAAETPAAPPPAVAANVAAKPEGAGASWMSAKDDDKQTADKSRDSPLKSFCWALLSSNEFLFID